MKRLLVTVALLVAVVGCGISNQQLVLAPSTCSQFSLIANVWSLQQLPNDLRREVEKLIVVAEGRNTHNATNPAGYWGDSVSRIGWLLRETVGVVRASISAGIEVFYRDPQTARVVEGLGVIFVEAGTGKMRLPDDPRNWVIETIWPTNEFVSPTISGGERRLWLFGEEWKHWCTMNIHGLVP